MQDLKSRLIASIQTLLGKLSVALSGAPTEGSKGLLDTALSFIGKDASPANLAPGELGCAESVSDIIIAAGFKMPVILSTRTLYSYFEASQDWLKIETPLAGDVIISPTGFGGKNGITNGHTGIVVNAGRIASNNSLTGLFDIHYTLDSWRRRYQVLGDYPVLFYRLIS